MTQTSTWMAIGKLGRTKGLKGEIYVDLYNPDSDLLENVEEFAVGTLIKNLDFVRVENVDVAGKRPVLKFKKIDSVEAAQSMVGKEIFVDRQALPKLGKNEFYVSDLVGIDVVDSAGEKIGTLSGVMPTGSNDIYVVQAGKKELLLPAIPAVVKKIDINHRKMTVVLPESIDAF